MTITAVLFLLISDTQVAVGFQWRGLGLSSSPSSTSCISPVMASQTGVCAGAVRTKIRQPIY